MKTLYLYLYPLFLVLCLLLPTLPLQAALVPIQKTNQTTKKRTYKKRRKCLRKLSSKQHKPLQSYRSKSKQKKHRRPDQKNDYEGIWALLISIVSIYFIIAITLTILGFVFMLPGLWIAGITLILAPFIVLLYFFIKGAVAQKKHREKPTKKKAEQKNK